LFSINLSNINYIQFFSSEQTKEHVTYLMVLTSEAFPLLNKEIIA